MSRAGGIPVVHGGEDVKEWHPQDGYFGDEGCGYFDAEWPD